jgi:hypothetical protein
MALRPLPTSYLFRQALESADNLDETGLEEWDHPPPYQSPPPSDMPSDRNYTLRLIDVLDGCRLRIYQEEARFCAGDVSRLRSLQQAVDENVG